MEIVLCNNKESWDAFAVENGASFLQSWEWGKVLQNEGKTVERLQVTEGVKIVAQAQIHYTTLFFGWRYVFCPGGPTVIKNEDLRMKIFEVIGEYLKKNKIIFFRFEPAIFSLQSSVFKRTIDINPHATVLLDLKKSEEKLLAAMHQKTRYNIRLAEKKDLTVREGKNFTVFLELMKKTGERDKFALHSLEHYKKVFESPLVTQYTAFSGAHAVATAVFIGFGNTFTYLYGASDHAYRQLMAPYLLQWNGILTGKKLGYAQYDFFGIAPPQGTRNKEQGTNEYEYDVEHQYAGVTRFKLGFGGTPVERPGTFDLLISRGKYTMYQFLRKLRRMV